MTSSEVHIYEPTGYAGIFQHACEVARIVGESGEVRVVVHTSRQHETFGAAGFDICGCTWWPRRSEGNGVLGTVAKRIAIAARLLLITLPHLMMTVRPRGVLHMQGPGPGNSLNLLFLWAARLRGCRVVYSPHDTFSRRGAIDDRILQFTYRPAHAVVVYSQADRDRLQDLGSRVHVSPLVQPVPEPAPEQIQNWRREWKADGPGETIVLCAGFVRPDKRLDLLITSARSWPKGRRLAVVGEDRGDWARCAQLAEQGGVDVASRIDFIELDEFAAAIAAADLVVVPAEKASQSGVLALARRLGTASVAADVGGMAELASHTFAAGNAEDLTATIQAALDSPRTCGVVPEDRVVAKSHRRAYDLPV